MLVNNYKHRFKARGKVIFEPTVDCRMKGAELLAFFRDVHFPSYFHHYRPGGHVAALHEHLANRYFFRIDLQNFFYSISRNRVVRALRACRCPMAETYGRWSCVPNPYGGPPAVSLPIGFVQSPLLASLVLMRSDVRKAIEELQQSKVLVSVYFDDLVGSSDDLGALERAYSEIQDACLAAQFSTNAEKLLPPAVAIEAFNCDLTHGKASVTVERIAVFESKMPDARSRKSFEAYCQLIEKRNRSLCGLK